MVHVGSDEFLDWVAHLEEHLNRKIEKADRTTRLGASS